MSQDNRLLSDIVGDRVRIKEALEKATKAGDAAYKKAFEKKIKELKSDGKTA